MRWIAGSSAQVEERGEAALQGVDGVGAGGRRLDASGAELALDLVVDLEEQMLLAAEVVVERPLGDAGLGRHLVERGPGEARRAEPAAGGGEQRTPGGIDVLVAQLRHRRHLPMTSLTR